MGNVGRGGMWPNNQAILLKIGLVLAVVVTSWLLIACIALQTERPATAATATVPGTRRDPTAPATPGAATPAGAPPADDRADEHRRAATTGSDGAVALCGDGAGHRHSACQTRRYRDDFALPCVQLSAVDLDTRAATH